MYIVKTCYFVYLLYCRGLPTVFIQLVILLWCDFIYEGNLRADVNKSGKLSLRAKRGVVPASVPFKGTQD
jgi:hypothetical protein